MYVYSFLYDNGHIILIVVFNFSSAFQCIHGWGNGKSENKIGRMRDFQRKGENGDYLIYMVNC